MSSHFGEQTHHAEGRRSQNRCPFAPALAQRSDEPAERHRDRLNHGIKPQLSLGLDQRAPIIEIEHRETSVAVIAQDDFAGFAPVVSMDLAYVSFLRLHHLKVAKGWS